MLFLSFCSDFLPFVKLVKTVLTVVEIGIPIILILLGVFDLGKAVTASKEDEIKAAQKLLIKRVIYAIAIFFVVLLVRVIFSVVASNTDDDDTSKADNWTECWDCKKKLKVWNSDTVVCDSECVKSKINGDYCYELKK